MRLARAALCLLLLVLAGGCPFSRPSLQSIAIEPAAPGLAAGATLQLVLRGTYSDGSKKDVAASAAWSSSAPRVARVGTRKGEKGRVLCLKPGSARISAALGTLSTSVKLVVTAPAPSSPAAPAAPAPSEPARPGSGGGIVTGPGAPPPASWISIQLTPTSAALDPGGTLQLAATGLHADGSVRDVTARLSWSSSAGAVATVDDGAAKGLVRALAPGEAEIAGVLDGIRVAARITVRDSALLTVLSVTEDAGIARTAEPVTAGVPLARERGIADARRLALHRSGREVPAQMTVLSRWDGPVSDGSKPIRWVLVDCQLDLAPGERADLELRDVGAPRASRPLPASPLAVDATSDPARVLVSTGSFRVALSRTRGTLIESASLGGADVLRDASGDGSRSGFVLENLARAAYRSSRGAPREVKVELAGPLRAVVKTTCELVGPGGEKLLGGKLVVVQRLTAFAGRSELSLETTLENNGWYGDFNGSETQAEWADFESARLDLPVVLGAARQFATDGVSSAGGPATRWRVLQAHGVVNPDDESANFAWTATRDGSLVGSGGRHPGWIAAGDGTLAVSAGMRWFWQTYEKALAVGGETLSFELWPDEGYFPPFRSSRGATGYRFQGGRHATSLAWVRFDSGALDAARAAARQAAFARPLLLRPTGAYVHETGALGVSDSGALAFSGTGMDSRLSAAYARYNRIHRILSGAAPADAGATTSTVSLVNAREQRYEASGTNADWYGWAHFGDNPWGAGWSSGHYDLGGSHLVHHLRLGDRALFERGEENAVFMSTYGQYFGRDANAYVASISWYEKTDHGTNEGGDYYRPAASHNWIRRLVYYHWLTGNQRAADAALANADALYRYFTEANDITRPGGLDDYAWHEARFSGWTLDNALVVYQLTGDAKWMRFAELLYRNGLRYLFDRSGHLEGPEARSTGQLLMTAYCSEPILRLYLESSDAALQADILALLRRIAAYADSDVTLAVGSGSSYQPICFPNDWDGGSPGPESRDTSLNGFFASVYAFVGWKDGRADYVARAHRLFADGVYYPFYYVGYPAHDAMDESRPQAYSWRSGQYSGSDSKIHGRFARQGLVYLYVADRLMRR